MLEREIGSEFWIEANVQRGLPSWDKQYRCLLSGRTALDYVARDIHAQRKFERVLLPSYCCETMIEPFARNGIIPVFYSVTPEVVYYDRNNLADAVLVIDYFGFALPQMELIARWAHEAGKIVIYDRTHLLTGNPTLEQWADYSVCSERKWFYSNSASVYKHSGPFCLPQPTARHLEYEILRRKAAVQKAAYIQTGFGDKTYLKLFSDAAALLHQDYQGYAGVPEQTDLQYLRRQRRENASILLEGLCDIADLRLWRPEQRETDLPLFVPILLEEPLRTELRRFLIERQIYCPIHWPQSDLLIINNEDQRLYLTELSLICDQRYKAEDIRRELDTIREFFGVI